MIAMLKKEKQKITVEIAGRNYPIIVEEGEDQSIQTIVQDVNEKIGHFKTTFNRKDSQDYVAMAFLSYSVDQHKTKQESQDTSQKDLTNRIDYIDKVLDRLIAI